MRLVAPNLIELLTLAQDATPDEIQQHEAFFGREWDAQEVAMSHFKRPGVKFVLLDDDDRPVAAGGYDEISPGVWHDWLLGTCDGWGKHWRQITKACRLAMDELLAGGAVRLQTASLESRTMAHRWYEKGLKMKYVGTVPNYCANGESVVLYERCQETPHGRK